MGSKPRSQNLGPRELEGFSDRDHGRSRKQEVMQVSMRACGRDDMRRKGRMEGCSCHTAAEGADGLRC